METMKYMWRWIFSFSKLLICSFSWTDIVCDINNMRNTSYNHQTAMVIIGLASPYIIAQIIRPTFTLPCLIIATMGRRASLLPQFLMLVRNTKWHTHTHTPWHTPPSTDSTKWETQSGIHTHTLTHTTIHWQHKVVNTKWDTHYHTPTALHFSLTLVPWAEMLEPVLVAEKLNLEIR